MQDIIQKRKRRFGAFLLAVLLFFNQATPFAANAADYPVSESELSGKIVQAGDTLTYTAESAGTYSIYYQDGAWNSIYTDSASYGTAYNVLDYSAIAEAPALSENAAFEGWQVTSVYESGGILESVTLCAMVRYPITYVGTEGAVNSNPTSYLYGEGVETLEAASKPGYSFDGWFADSEYTTEAPGIDSYQEGEITLYAKFTQNPSYTITYVLDGGTNADNPDSYIQGIGTELAAASKTGYTFDGWYSDAALATREDSIDTDRTGDITLYAKFTIKQYTITFDTAGGSEIASITQDYGTAVTAPAEPTKTGYTFAGWDKTIPATMPAEDVTITAQWTANKYTIQFVNEDGTQLQSSEVAYGETPVYTGDAPTKAATAEYTYTFSGWTPEIVAVTGEATYTATYRETANAYTITFDTNGGSEIASITQDYGTAVTAPTAPTRTGYTFAGWDREIPSTMPAENITITAQWTANKYTIRFVNEDGTQLQSSEVAYGETPIYSGETPTKAATAQYTYAFAGWSPAITAVTGEATYTATYTAQTNQYTVQFVNEDGTQLQSSEVAYGETPVYSGETPTKAATAQYTYTFAGWTPAVTAVTGDATYMATYTAVVNQYTITFDTNGGSAVAAITADYGAAITAPAEPVREGYTFAGWDQDIPATMPAENITITAQWTVNKYTVKFVNDDGTQLQSSEVAYGETPVYSGATPTKAATAQYTYTFDGWSPAITAVTGEATYTATYTAQTNQYTVQFVNEDGTQLQSSEVAYGETPVYSGETPTKAATAQYTYTFDGWSPAITAVTGETTYTAAYTQTPNPYTITFDTDGGSEVAPITQGYGTAVTAPAAPTRTGYTFAGWNREIPATMPAENITITAQWTVKKYTIKFVNGDGTQLQSSKVAYGETPGYNGATPTKAATAQYTYTFDGWSPAITAVTGETTYTAAYTQTPNPYTITFDTDGGSEVAPITQGYGTTVTAPAAPTRTGYTFAGWDQEIPATMPAENITITAQWTANRYSISYTLNGGTNGNNPDSYTYETGVSELVDAVKPGYVFAGWYENADFSGEKVTSIAADRTDDVMLYAKFEMGAIEAGTYFLTAGVPYKLGNVTKVSGDSNEYTAGSIFYVPVSGTYTFS